MELEVRVVGVPRKEVVRRAYLEGAKLLHSTRLIADRRFRLNGHTPDVSEISESVITNTADFRELITRGLEHRLRSGSGKLIISPNNNCPERRIRIRKDGQKRNVINVKSLKDPASRVAKRHEWEAGIAHPTSSELNELLTGLGYQYVGTFEFLRQSFLLNGVIIDSNHIALRTIGEICWFELEVNNSNLEYLLFETLETLGYGQEDLVSNSLKSFLIKSGVTAEKLANFRMR